MSREGLLTGKAASGLVLSGLFFFALFAGFAATAQDQPDNGPVYLIDRFVIRYHPSDRGFPPARDLMAIELLLGQADGCYRQYAEARDFLKLRLKDLPELGPQRFHHTAIRAINDQIVAHLNSLGLIGVTITPDPADIDSAGRDLRPAEALALRLVIRYGRVQTICTLASGDRIPPSERLNHPLHRRIIEQSPVQPSADSADGLLRKDLLDDYLFQLNRHPGRRVDAAITPSAEPRSVTLEYLVSEKKPWLAYVQTSNTGTDQTKDWRWRFGYVNNQLFNNDDIFSLDFLTTDFFSDESRALLASYEAPVADFQRLRWGLFAQISDFESSDVGLASEGFSSKTKKVGGELYYNFYQNRRLFVDALAGLRWEDISVNNKTVLVKGHESLLLPYLGVRFQHQTERSSTLGRMTFESVLGSMNRTELTGFGRSNPDDSWDLLKWDFSHASFLEPLLDQDAWEDPQTPATSTLAHEVAISFRGQHAFGSRVIPQHMGVLGGAYSVRGYPEAITTGDETLLGSLEYRYHLPRAFTLEPDPSRTPLFGQSFRYAPQQVYGRPDWDLVLRAFVDAGQSTYASAISLEDDENLLGAGLGIEFVFKENLSLRADLGVALREARKNTADEVDTGDGQIHITATLLF